MAKQQQFVSSAPQETDEAKILQLYSTVFSSGIAHKNAITPAST